MAKKKKYPKRPKESAPLSTWRRYEERVKEVDKYNNSLEKEKNEKKKIIERAKRLRK